MNKSLIPIKYELRTCFTYLIGSILSFFFQFIPYSSLHASTDLTKSLSDLLTISEAVIDNHTIPENQQLTEIQAIYTQEGHYGFTGKGRVTTIVPHSQHRLDANNVLPIR